MDEEDEIDVLGEYNLECLLSKNDSEISSCYDGDQHLGLHCESTWVLDNPSHPCWYDNKSDLHSSFGGISALNTVESCNTNLWSDKERYLLEKGVELFGRSWSRLAQYIGTKTSSQVKSYVKSMAVGLSEKTSVPVSSFGEDNMELNFSELIDDMDIPASMEEVIAAVSTAKPTILVPSSQKEVSIVDTESSSNRKNKCKKNNNLTPKRYHAPKVNKIIQLYNAKDIKDVLIGNKEQDTIVLPNGEQVVRMRRRSSSSNDSDVEIDSDLDYANIDDHVKKDFPLKEKIQVFKDDKEQVTIKPSNVTKENNSQFQDENTSKILNIGNHESFELFIDDVQKEVSVFTDDFIEEGQEDISEIQRETEIFKGDLVTPSGKVMTVIVDDMSNTYPTTSETGFKPIQSVVSKYTSAIQQRLETVYKLSPPAKEEIIEPSLVTQEEKLLHPEFFSRTHLGLHRYLKIRNHIVECWKKVKPNYVTKTSVRAGLKNCGDVNLISRIHAYLEQRGYINFGCEQCHYNCKSIPTFDSYCNRFHGDIVETVNTDAVESGEVGKRESCRARKKKLPFEEIYENGKVQTIRSVKKQVGKNVKSGHPNGFTKSKPWKTRKRKITNSHFEGGYTLVHSESEEVTIQHEKSRPNKINTRGIKPVKLIHCKNYSFTNKAPYRVELEVSALLSVDVHSHLSPKSEVIGLLGGTYNSSHGILSITVAVPCQTILSSNIHCDMCPVSQCESSEHIINKGLSVVGWYHSHPNFDPSPSDTDVDTQNTLQSWFNETGKPFIGLIISPYYSVHNVSSYRCCQVKMENSGPMPYQLEVKLTNFCDDDPLIIRQSIDESFKTIEKKEPIKHLNIYKCLESVKHHLRRSTPKVGEEKISRVIQEIRDFFKNSIKL